MVVFGRLFFFVCLFCLFALLLLVLFSRFWSLIKQLPIVIGRQSNFGTWLCVVWVRLHSSFVLLSLPFGKPCLVARLIALNGAGVVFIFFVDGIRLRARVCGTSNVCGLFQVPRQSFAIVY